MIIRNYAGSGTSALWPVKHFCLGHMTAFWVLSFYVQLQHIKVRWLWFVILFTDWQKKCPFRRMGLHLRPRCLLNDHHKNVIKLGPVRWMSQRMTISTYNWKSSPNWDCKSRTTYIEFKPWSKNPDNFCVVQWANFLSVYGFDFACNKETIYYKRQ